MLDKMGELIDDHQEWGKDGTNGNVKQKGKKATGRHVYSKEELKKIKDEIKEAMVSAAQSTGAGSLPGAIQRMKKDLLEPKMDWREILQQQIMSTIIIKKQSYIASYYEGTR